MQMMWHVIKYIKAEILENEQTDVMVQHRLYADIFATGYTDSLICGLEKYYITRTIYVFYTCKYVIFTTFLAFVQWTVF